MWSARWVRSPTSSAWTSEARAGAGAAARTSAAIRGTREVAVDTAPARQVLVIGTPALDNTTDPRGAGPDGAGTVQNLQHTPGADRSLTDGRAERGARRALPVSARRESFPCGARGRGSRP